MKKKIYLTASSLPVNLHNMLLWGIVMWLVSKQVNWPSWIWGSIGTIYLILFSAAFVVIVKGTYINPFEEIKKPGKEDEYLTFEDMIEQARK